MEGSLIAGDSRHGCTLLDWWRVPVRLVTPEMLLGDERLAVDGWRLIDDISAWREL